MSLQLRCVGTRLTRIAPCRPHGFGHHGAGGAGRGEYRVRYGAATQGPAGRHATAARRFAPIPLHQGDRRLRGRCRAVAARRRRAGPRRRSSFRFMAAAPTSPSCRCARWRGPCRRRATRRCDQYAPARHHINTDNFFDVRMDIEAAVATAKALGYTLDRARRAQPRHRPGRVLRRHPLGPGDQGRRPHRSFRQAAVEVAQHHHPRRRHRTKSCGGGCSLR